MRAYRKRRRSKIRPRDLVSIGLLVAWLSWLGITVNSELMLLGKLFLVVF